MDITTLLGLIVGIAIVALAILTGSDFWIFLNLPSFLIVVGGTFAATLIKFPLASVLVAFRLGLRAASGRITAQGFAASRPLAPNDSAENRARNRRVEIIVRGE